MFCLMSNFLQDALQGLDDEELERYVRGPTLNGSFESSISGGKLKDFTSMVLQVDNAYMHATTAADHVSCTATVQASPKGTITLDGTDAASLAS